VVVVDDVGVSLVPKQHKVQSGDCVSSIAFNAGFFAGTLWELPENADLKQQRANLNVLRPGDIVYIPDKRDKMHKGNTDARHIFRRKGVPARLALRIVRGDAPRANLPYLLIIDRHKITGTTNGNGEISVTLIPNAKSGVLQVGVGADMDEYTLQLGHLQPVDTILGVQRRLSNLGYFCQGEDGELGPYTKAAICDFQQEHNLTVTGEMDAAFTATLVKVHDEE
jgi:hypothetical protein